ncbi:hypothetical protein NLI96_g8868 [Meripilus lineatus]|uniref:F-box domain-containing protein n=1 Tax=Meripilus lineatus TaxID=2056292 RepID=A0AAD5UWW8_9APHY|nr:hypothetical protein NLI96_g8868 [Physisporinus lineatus]
MQASKLPIEVCERVIDCLTGSVHGPTYFDYNSAIQSNPTLYACALVCHDWAHRSQHHLFRQVRLRTTHQAHAFLDVITQHPDRAKLVRCLEIWPHPPHSPPSLPQPVSLSPKPSDSPAPASSPVITLRLDPPAPSTFPVAVSSSPHSPQLSSVSSNRLSKVGQTSFQPESGDPAHPPTPVSPEFNIPLQDQTQDKAEVPSISSSYYNWIYKLLMQLPPLLKNLSALIFDGLPTLHPRFIRLVSCFKTVKALTLQNLSAQSFSEIIQLINRLPQLTFLNIGNMEWVRPARFFPSHRIRLEQFICDIASDGMMVDMLDWLESLQHLSGLRYLDIFIPKSSAMNKVHHILHRCTHSLRFLRLYSDSKDIFEPLSLSSHSQLEYLEIWISRSPFPNHAALFSSCISKLLSPSLVCLRIAYFQNLDAESFAASQSSWKDVDDALSDPKFNRLTYFVMNISTGHETTPDRKTLRTTFNTIFPKSYKRGILWVTSNGKFRADDEGFDAQNINGIPGKEELERMPNSEPTTDAIGLEYFKTVRVPFASSKHAIIAKQVIEVDIELQPQAVQRTIEVEGDILVATFATLTVRLARLVVNAFLENVDLVVRTIGQFGDDAEQSITEAS